MFGFYDARSLFLVCGAAIYPDVSAAAVISHEMVSHYRLKVAVLSGSGFCFDRPTLIFDY